MMDAPAFKGLRWNCGDYGETCFVRRCLVKFEAFDGCFPGRIAPTDFDMVVEANGCILVAEWKYRRPKSWEGGQRILFERLSRLSDRITVIIVVCPDMESMAVEEMAVVHNGGLGEWHRCNLRQLRVWVRGWFREAMNRAPLPPIKERQAVA